MDDKSPDYLKNPFDEFKEMVLTYIQDTGYHILSTAIADTGIITIEASKSGQETGCDTVFRVIRREKSVGVKEIRSFTTDLSDSDGSSGIFISLSGFTKKARELSVENSIELIETLDNTQEMHDMDLNPDKIIYEEAFESSISLKDARSLFERGLKKPLFGLFGVEETVRRVDGRYAPLGCFELYHGDDEKSLIYINLSKCVLYFIHRGLLGSSPSVKYSNIFRRILDLPLESVSILSEIIDTGEVSYPQLIESHGLSEASNVDYIVLLRNMGLIDISSDGRKLLLNTRILRYGDKKYNLEDYLKTVSSIDSDFEADEIVYNPSSIIQHIEVLFDVKVKFNKVIYMPYFTCEIIGDKTGNTYEELLTPLFNEGV